MDNLRLIVTLWYTYINIAIEAMAQSKLR
jgi:hypothetical protein